MIVSPDKISFEERDGWIKGGNAWYHPDLRKMMESGLTTLPMPDSPEPRLDSELDS